MHLRRSLEAEWLDILPPGDARAGASRRDLRWINKLMGHTRILRHALKDQGGATPVSLLDLGAGDGTLMLAVARRLRWPRVTLTLLDRHQLAADESLNGFAALGWKVDVVASDVFDFLRSAKSFSFDITVANLFLHHFSDRDLLALFAHLSRLTRVFIAVEPRRSPIPLLASRSLWAIGANDVTRHDAPASVRAGFAGDELSLLWPHASGWRLQERGTGLFSHCFVACCDG
jgi:hypothetical protein